MFDPLQDPSLQIICMHYEDNMQQLKLSSLYIQAREKKKSCQFVTRYGNVGSRDDKLNFRSDQNFCQSRHPAKCLCDADPETSKFSRRVSAMESNSFVILQ